MWRLKKLLNIHLTASTGSRTSLQITQHIVDECAEKKTNCATFLSLNREEHQQNYWDLVDVGNSISFQISYRV
jgi:ribosomal silencing factor RsfS